MKYRNVRLYTYKMIEEYYDLSSFPVVRSGGMRSVHLLPDNPSVILKTNKRDRFRDDGHIVSRKPWKRWRTVGGHHIFSREVQEYFRLKHHTYGEPEASLPIPAIYGFADTSNGLGLLIEKVSDENGGFAPTMRELVKSGALETKHKKAFAAFEAKCREMQLILGDANPANFVYTEARSGEPEWVCVDGFGSTTLIPVKLHSQWVNGRSLERKFKWLNAFLDQQMRSSNRLPAEALVQPTKNPAISHRV